MLFFAAIFNGVTLLKLHSMAYVYHVAIKKAYAEAILDDLHEINAVGLLKTAADIAVEVKLNFAGDMLYHLERLQAIELWGDENNEVPEWQMREVLRTKAEVEKDPSLLIDEKVIFHMLKVD